MLVAFILGFASALGFLSEDIIHHTPGDALSLDGRAALSRQVRTGLQALSLPLLHISILVSARKHNCFRFWVVCIALILGWPASMLP